MVQILKLLLFPTYLIIYRKSTYHSNFYTKVHQTLKFYLMILNTLEYDLILMEDTQILKKTLFFSIKIFVSSLNLKFIYNILINL